MSGTLGGPDPAPGGIVVAGHLCVDLIPRLDREPTGSGFEPGSLDAIGPIGLAIAGCVGNTGMALLRLGVAPVLVARVGSDPLGRLLADLVSRSVPEGCARLVAAPGSGSYSLVFSRPGRDRAIQHHPGVNDTFVAGDVPEDVLRGARLLHVGYPPLMAAMIADDGRELGHLLRAAHGHGVTTSLDMANARFDGRDERVSWRRILERVLPDVDLFLPSLDEACHALERHVDREADGAPSFESLRRLCDAMLDLGVAIAGVKLGEHGLYLRTARKARLEGLCLGDAADWQDRELYSPVFEADVEGTLGAGDATIAGFLFGLLRGMSPDAALTAACAVGASSTEAADGSSSVPSWDEVERRLERGWSRAEADPGPGWRRASRGLWFGPGDAARSG